MKDLVKILNDVTDEVKRLTEKLQKYDNIKEVFDNTLKRSLFKCVLDDCEITLVEYILAENEEEAMKEFGWEDCKDARVEKIMDEGEFAQLLRIFRVRTVEESD
jgi:hypothetical protein